MTHILRGRLLLWHETHPLLKLELEFGQLGFELAGIVVAVLGTQDRSYQEDKEESLLLTIVKMQQNGQV